jgi:thiol-disulfide isomerase/thioredoxin
MAVLAVLALLGYGVITKGRAALEVGEVAPVTELDVLAPEGSPDAGQTASLADYRGQWVLLNTWASWCGPCEDESPDLVAFHRKHSKDGNFTVLGVQTQDGTAEGLEFVEEFGLIYPSIRDGSGDYADDLGATGVPDSLLIDPEGKVAYIRRGQIDAEILDAEFLPIIEGSDAPGA